MTDEKDFLSGAVSEPTSYTPVPKTKFRAAIALAELVDPATMGWEPDEDASEADKADFFRPFVRLRWQIEAQQNGEYTEYAGRMTDMRVSLKSGVNPKTGRSFAEGRADLIRLKNGLGPKDEVVGLALYKSDDLGELSREDAIAQVNARLKEYEGLRAVVRVAHIKNRSTGELRDSVVKIVLG